MNRKGFEISTIILVMVLFVTAALIVAGFTSTAKGGQNTISRFEPPSGSNQSKTEECKQKCAAPANAACTAIDAELGITCKDYLANLGRTIDADYPEVIGVGINSIAITLKDKDAPISGASINGIEGFSEDPAGSGIYKGTIDTRNIEAGYILLTASVPMVEGKPTYTSARISILVKNGAPIITGDGGPGDETGTGKSIVLYTDAAYAPASKTSVVKAGQDIYVKIKVGGSEFVPSIEVKLFKGTEEITGKCNLPAGANCIETSGNRFKVPAAALSNYDYTLKIRAVKSAAETATRQIGFSWRCPAIVLEPAKPFGAGDVLTAAFDSAITDMNKVVVKINTNAIAPDSFDKPAGKVTFTIPKVGVSGFRDGSNTLLIERNGEGLCIKNDAHTYWNDVVINYLEKPFTYTCPAAGCSGDYVLTDKAAAGGNEDTKTGCRYNTKASAACEMGCESGKCKAPDIKITLAYVDDSLLGPSSAIYEGAHILKVAVKNAGTMPAFELLSGVTAKLGDTDLTLLTTDNSFDTLTADNPATTEDESLKNYLFAIPAGTPAISPGQPSGSATLNISAFGASRDNGPLEDFNPQDNTKSYAFKVWKAYFSENFNDVGALFDWNGPGWKIYCNADGESCNSNNIYGGFASNDATTVQLSSPPISLTDATTVKLSFKWRRNASNQKLTVTVWNGANKCAAPVILTSTSNAGWNSEKIDISTCADKSVRVKFVSENAVYWGIDDVIAASK